MANSGSETRRRKKLLPVRCTDEELAAIVSAAANSSLSVAAFVRQRTIGTAGPRSVRKRTDLAELGRLLGETGKIGSNINQLARVANSGGDLPTAGRLDEIWRELNEIRTALMRALGRGD